MASGITVTFSLLVKLTVYLAVFLTSPILSNTLASFCIPRFIALTPSTALSAVLAASTALSIARTPFIAAPAPPGITGKATAAASSTIPTPSTIDPTTLPPCTLLTKLLTPIARLAISHADSIYSPVGSTYIIGFPAQYPYGLTS